MKWKALGWSLVGCAAVIAAVSGGIFKMKKDFHDEMNARTLVRLSLSPEEKALSSIDLELCGHHTHFTRAELLDTVIRNLPTWELAPKCPVIFRCRSVDSSSVSYVLDSIEYQGISGEHAFSITAQGIAYHYWP